MTDTASRERAREIAGRLIPEVIAENGMLRGRLIAMSRWQLAYDAAMLAFAEQAPPAIDRGEATGEMSRAMRLKLDRRIHNQRRALRENWEIVERRAYWLKCYPLQSRYLAHCMTLRRRINQLEAALSMPADEGEE